MAGRQTGEAQGWNYGLEQQEQTNDRKNVRNGIQRIRLVPDGDGDAEEHQRAYPAKPDNVMSYMRTMLPVEIAQFAESGMRTGFDDLDRLSGGLYPGLICIAAIPSLGKTTFSLQLADQVATAGNDVVFFSLEQSRLELATKSLARITAQMDMDTAVTSLAVRKGYLLRQVVDAIEQYEGMVSDRVSIVCSPQEESGCDVAFICDYVHSYVQKTGAKPVVIIDYLQILKESPQTFRKQTTKEALDNNLTALKSLSRQLSIPVIVISSVNRASYLAPISFESLKESGGIEYACDVIWGLQLQCMNDEIFSKPNSLQEKREAVKEAKRATPRKIELCCLKNRHGAAGFSCHFDYFSAFDLFVEAEDEEQQPSVRTVYRRQKRS